MERIGLIADTHDEVVPWDTVAAQVADAFFGVELILHCGDLTTTRVLDRLEEIAPVIAVRSPADPPPEASRLIDGPHVIDAGGLKIGLVNTLVEDPIAIFGRRVDVVVHGGTHEAAIDEGESLLLVNPGSPTLASEATVGVLDLSASPPTAVIVRL